MPSSNDYYGRYSNIADQIYKRGRYNTPIEPEFDYLDQMQQIVNRSERLRQKALAQQLRNSQIQLANQQTSPPRFRFHNELTGGGLNPKPTGLGTRNKRMFSPFIQSIIGQESGGNTKAISSAGAMGKYQIMPANILGPGGWDVEALGKNVSRRKFLNREKLQDRIAINKLREYYRLYGAGGAAAAWYSGDPNRKNDYSGVSSGPSVGEYVDEVLQRARRIKRRQRRR